MKIFYVIWIFSVSILLLLSVTAKNNADQILLLWAFFAAPGGGILAVLLNYRRRNPRNLEHWKSIAALPVGVTMVFIIIIIYLFLRDFGIGIG